MATWQPEPEPEVAVVCLQAQHVAGLPAAAEGREVLLRLLQQPQLPVSAAAATCTGGVAAFQDQLLLLHCAPCPSIGGSISTVLAVAVTTAAAGSVSVSLNLAEQLRRPSPVALHFVLGGATAIAGAVLTLTLHHRLVKEPPRPHRGGYGSVCMPHLLLRLRCLRLRVPPPAAAHHHHHDDDQSSGFITIEKGTISRRRPPSDNLLNTDDDEVDGGNNKKPASAAATNRSYCCWPPLDLDTKVEDEFLAMLELEAAGDLDIKDAEADVADGRP